MIAATRQKAEAWVSSIGRTTIAMVQGCGVAGVLLIDALKGMVAPPFRPKLFAKQMEFIGNKSLWITILSATSIGMVMTIQSYFQLKNFSAETVVGGMVAAAMTRELGPLLTALMVNARAGSAIAAELGTMRVTEQIDALQSMAINPVQYLVTPRIFAGVTMLPVLTVLANVTGIMGSYLVGVVLLKVDEGIFWQKVTDFVSFRDIIGSLLKAAIFGLVLTHVGCFKGYYTTNGAEGVGRATTEAVTFSAIFILISDYIFTSFWQR